MSLGRPHDSFYLTEDGRPDTGYVPDHLVASMFMFLEAENKNSDYPEERKASGKQDQSKETGSHQSSPGYSELMLQRLWLPFRTQYYRGWGECSVLHICFSQCLSVTSTSHRSYSTSSQSLQHAPECGAHGCLDLICF